MTVHATPPASMPPEEAIGVPALSVRYEARTPAFRRYVWAYAAGNLGVALLWGTITTIILPLQVQGLEFAQIFTGADSGVDIQALTNLQAQIAANHATPTGEQQRLFGLLAEYNASKAGALSLVTSVSIFAMMLVQPIIGMVSDRTRSPWGRRAPWIVGGGVAGAALVALMPLVPSVAVLIVLWTGVQLASNLTLGPLQATVADRVPENRIGRVSTVTGVIQYLGTLVGALLAGVLFGAIGLGAYFPVAFTFGICSVLFALIARDKSSKGIKTAPMNVRSFFASYIAALRDRDFRWAWIAKVVLQAGFAIGTVYSVYLLQSYVQPALSATEAAQIAPLLALSGFPLALVGMVIVGRWSDRIQRRKPFVFASSLLIAVSFLVPLVWPSLPAMFVQAVLAGLGLAIFSVVDQALFIDVLPDRSAAGRDLGMGSVAGSVGSSLGPVIAGLVVAMFAGQYGPIFPVAFAFVLIAAFAVLPIKRVR